MGIDSTPTKDDSPEGKERRQSPRLALRVPFRARLRWTAGDWAEAARLFDVSGTGVGALFERAPRPGVAVPPRARIELAAPGAIPPIAVALHHHGGLRVGVEFTETGGGALEALRLHLLAIVGEEGAGLAAGWTLSGADATARSPEPPRASNPFATLLEAAEVSVIVLRDSEAGSSGGALDEARALLRDARAAYDGTLEPPDWREGVPDYLLRRLEAAARRVAALPGSEHRDLAQQRLRAAHAEFSLMVGRLDRLCKG